MRELPCVERGTEKPCTRINSIRCRDPSHHWRNGPNNGTGPCIRNRYPLQRSINQSATFIPGKMRPVPSVKRTHVTYYMIMFDPPRHAVKGFTRAYKVEIPARPDRIPAEKAWAGVRLCLTSTRFRVRDICESRGTVSQSRLAYTTQQNKSI